MNRRPRIHRLFLACALVLVPATGCSYYEITDPGSGEVYYATKPKTYKGSGAVVFDDAVTGQRVTLTGTRIRKIDKAAWNKAVELGKAD